MSKLPDFYQILGLEKNATDDEIKKAYTILARKYHPDKNNSPTATEKFQQINGAYHVLIDPQKRRQYDLTGADDLPNFGVGVNIWSVLNEYFMSQKIDMVLKISYDQLIYGSEMDVLVEETVFVDNLGNPAKKIKCPSCKNHGSYKLMGMICMVCASQGEIYPGGTIKKQIKKEIHVVIPIKSWVGRVLKSGGKNFKIMVEGTNNLYHNGIDLIYIQEINLFSALLGFDEELTIIGKNYKVSYPKPIEPNSEIKLENYGLYGKDGRRGNLIVKFKLIFPEKLSERQKRHIQKCLPKAKK